MAGIQKTDNSQLPNVLNTAAWAQGCIRCSYLSFFDEKGKLLFVINRAEAKTTPLVYCNKRKPKATNNNYIEVYLTDEAIQFISDRVKNNQRTAYFEQVLNQKGTVFVREQNVIWKGMSEQEQEKAQESVVEEEKPQGSSALVLLAGVVLMLIGR